MIYLIRHGQTAMNQSKQFQGHMDTELDMEGIRQAEVLSTFFKTLNIKEIHTSDLKRAVQTATAIQKTTSAPIINDVRLRELDVGIYEGKSWDDIQSDHASFLSMLKGVNADQPIPGGESIGDFQKRSLMAFDDIIKRVTRDENVVVVTHGGVIKMIVLFILGQSLNDDDIRIDNAHVTIIGLGHNNKKAEVIAMNVNPDVKTSKTNHS